MHEHGRHGREAVPGVSGGDRGFDPRWANVPERGVGIVFMPGLAEAIAGASDLIDFIEVEPQQHWRRGTRHGAQFRLDAGAFDAIAATGKPCVMHSVGSPVGGTLTLLPEQRQALCESIARLQPAWVSEHLSFNAFAHGDAVHHAGFLLPPLPCEASAVIAVKGLRDLHAVVARPLAFETGVNYLQPQAGEWSDGRFVREVALRSGCGILLDLHNAWCNARNGRQALQRFLDELPLDRVVEIHLAGGEALDGYWLDAHSGLVAEALLGIAAALVPRLPALRAITFEMMDEALASGACDLGRLRAQLLRLREIWKTRGRAVGTPGHGSSHLGAPPPQDGECLPAPGEWETTLGLLATGVDPGDTAVHPSTLARRLRADPGIAVLRQLVEAVRAGTVIDTLRLSLRLLALQRGRDGIAQLFAGYWRRQSPLPIATDEALRFGEYLRGQALPLPGLDDLLALELAACRALGDGEAVSVTLAGDPAELIDAIEQRRLPQPRERSPVTLQLAPAS